MPHVRCPHCLAEQPRTPIAAAPDLASHAVLSMCKNCGREFDAEAAESTPAAPQSSVSFSLASSLYDSPSQSGVFGDYKLVEEITRGGMGVVYKATHLPLKRTVALKMIKSGALASERDVQRFFIEAEAAAKLDHPGIVPVYEVGVHQSQHFYSMGYVEGSSLRAQLTDGPFGNYRAATIAWNLADAVQYAHENGIIHRDLKPDNVLMSGASSHVPSETRSGTKRTHRSGSASGLSARHAELSTAPRIADFGLAKQVSEDSGLTATGAVIGTPSYMAPEQALGLNVDPRADVYSLGAILYCMLTGRPPFHAPTVMETLKQVVDQPPAPPRQLNTTVERDLETICLKCLEKSPARRYASAGDLADDLERYLNDEPIAARAVGPLERNWRWVRRHPMQTALATMMLIAIVAGAALWGSLDREGKLLAARDQLEQALDTESQLKSQVEEALEETRQTVMERDDALQQLQGTNEQLEEINQELDEEKREVAAARDQLNSILYLRRIGLAYSEWKGGRIEAAQELLDSAPAELRNWEWHFLNRLCAQTKHSLDDHDRPVFGVGFTDNGKHLLSLALDNQLVIRDAATGAAIKRLSGFGRYAYRMAFTPDGQHVAIACYDSTIRVVNLRSMEKAFELKIGRGYAWGVTIHPNGKFLAAGSQDGSWSVWDFTTHEVVHESKGPGETKGLAFSPSGEHLIRGGSNLQVIRVSDWSIEKQWDHPGAVEDLAFEPSGEWFVTASRDKLARVWSMEDQSTKHVLSGATAEIRSVAVSHDGKWIAAGGEDRLIRVYNAVDGQLHDTLRGHELAVYGLAFAADDSTIASASYDQSVKLWPLNGGQEAATLTSDSGRCTHAQFSPDSSLLAVACPDHVDLWNLQDRTKQRLDSSVQGRPQMAFRRDGKRLAIATSAVEIWDTDSASRIQSIPIPAPQNHARNIYEVVSLEYWDDNNILCLLSDGKVISWSETGAELQRHKFDRSWIAARSHGPARVAVVEAGPNHIEFNLHDMTSDEPMTSLFHHRMEVAGAIVYECDISSDGQYAIFSGGGDFSPHIYDLQEGKPQCKLSGHKQMVFAANFSPDGKRVLTASRDRTVRLWDVETGLSILTLEGHADEVRGATFSPDGKKIATVAFDGAVRIWTANE